MFYQLLVFSKQDLKKSDPKLVLKPSSRNLLLLSWSLSTVMTGLKLAIDICLNGSLPVLWKNVLSWITVWCSKMESQSRWQQSAIQHCWLLLTLHVDAMVDRDEATERWPLCFLFVTSPHTCIICSCVVYQH